MRAIKRLVLMMILFQLGYIAFMISPFLEILEREKENGNKY